MLEVMKATPEQWNDWHWQMRHRITSAEILRQFIQLSPEEEKGIEWASSQRSLPLAVPPYFVSLMDPKDPDCPIRKQVICRVEESYDAVFDMQDPCGEDSHTPVPNLVHRYPDRVLLIATDRCLSYCRYCTRKRIVGSGEVGLSNEKLERICQYLERTPKVRDVLISGGDPLIQSDERIDHLLGRLRQIPHLEILRIGTRAPIFIPQRVTQNLVSVLKKYHPFMMSIHINHPKELAPEVKAALEALADGGIPLGSQTVLLKGVNDHPDIIMKLCHELLKARVKPYYLYQCDPVFGTEHFRTSVDAGVKIIEKLRGHTTGYAVPTFVVDAPGGGGKIPLSPNYVISQIRGKTILRNYEDKVFEYHDPLEIGAKKKRSKSREVSSVQLSLPCMEETENTIEKPSKRIKMKAS
jgi:lysine 2,3-aminomutase